MAQNTGRSLVPHVWLPPADEEPIAAEVPPHEILGVAPNASESEIRNTFREKAKVAHPDNSGSTAEFRRIKDAYEAMTNGRPEGER
ncbi:J domain-containing protein [Haloterrigena salifodinae]|uniref:J domain-containing protein n=1 Tax=Haloterrigena salifodinae TaxID=2675099 RepID=UPI000F890CB1|nr:J domain-containing protein [Haloterrigena salifodinae]